MLSHTYTEGKHILNAKFKPCIFPDRVNKDFKCNNLKIEYDKKNNYKEILTCAVKQCPFECDLKKNTY